MSNHHPTVFGILGGMGPLASAEYLRTVYEQSLGESEQAAPIVLVYSDPSVPVRADLDRREVREALLPRLTEGLTVLARMGADRIVICCVTVHYLLPWLPPELRERIVSLIDVVFSELQKAKQRKLMICSNESRRLGLFKTHPRWPEAAEFLAWPDEQDQQRINEIITRIKRNQDVGACAAVVKSLLEKHGVNSFVAGCSEIHLLTKAILRSGEDRMPGGCIDPLLIVAERLAQEYR
jgi:aspartate racemase